MRTHFHRVWAVNRSAWDLWRVVCGRTVTDLKLGSTVIDRATAHKAPGAALDLIERISLIRDVLDPPKTHG